MAVLAQSSLATMRLGASRLNFHNVLVYVTIGGTRRETKVRREGITIRQTINSTPDTASMRVWGFTPTALQDVKIYIGSTAATELVFGGTIQRVTQVAEGDPPSRAAVAYDIDCVDYTWLMDRRLVFKQYTSQSATAIAKDIISSFTSGYTSHLVQAGLPSVTVAFDGVSPSSAMTTLAQLVGGHWKITPSKDLRFVTTSGIGLPDPATLTASNLTMDNPLTAVSDGSQVRTRVYVIGKGTVAVATASAGDIVLPVSDTTLFSSGTVDVIGQRIMYTGVASAYTGTIVGSGAGPTSAPTALLNSTASSLVAGAAYQYAVTFVTASGETTAGPTVRVTPLSANLPTPTETPTFYSQIGIAGGLVASGTYQYKLTAGVDGGGETDPGPASAVITPTGTSVQISWSITVQAGTRYVNLYRTTNGGATFKLVQQFDLNGVWPSIVANGGTWDYGGYIDSLADGSLGANTPGANTASRGSIDLIGIPIGGSTVTQRKIYRTVANGTQLKLLATIADNTTTTSTDSAADSTLGANVPSSDTSGLTLPSGQVGAGSTTMRVAGTTPFSSTGGWVLVGNQSIRYTGKDTQNLTGIPASGVGAIASTIAYGTAVTIPPTLTGIPSSGPGAIAATVNVGDAARPVVQRDDTTAQSTIAAAEGGDGVHEDKIDDDTLATVAAMNSAGDAALTLFKNVENQNTFSARDYKLQVGTTVTLSLGTPTNVSGTRTVQSVALSQLGLTPDPTAKGFLYPLRTVEVGTTRLTLPEFLKQLGL